MKLTAAYQATKSMLGSSLNYVSNIANIYDRAGNLSYCKGLTVNNLSSDGGALEIHLLDDYDSNGAKIWTVINLASTDRQFGPCLFDAVRSTNTTIAIADLILWVEQI